MCDVIFYVQINALIEMKSEVYVNAKYVIRQYWISVTRRAALRLVLHCVPYQSASVQSKHVPTRFKKEFSKASNIDKEYKNSTRFS